MFNFINCMMNTSSVMYVNMNTKIMNKFEEMIRTESQVKIRKLSAILTIVNLALPADDRV